MVVREERRWGALRNFPGGQELLWISGVWPKLNRALHLAHVINKFPLCLADGLAALSFSISSLTLIGMLAVITYTVSGQQRIGNGGWLLVPHRFACVYEGCVRRDCSALSRGSIFRHNMHVSVHNLSMLVYPFIGWSEWFLYC